jgi:type IV pilus assembly protein PilX
MIKQNMRTFKKMQSGVVLIFALMALVILLIACIALVRSTDTNLILAGNLAFKRDVINQAERAIPEIKTRFQTGSLSKDTARQSDQPSSNYYATIQKNNSNHIPIALMKIADGNVNNIVDSKAQVTVRYVIDRMCLTTGEINSKSCSFGDSTTDLGGTNVPRKAPGEDIPIYRISIRATGPHNAEAFIQSSFSN